MDEKQETRVMVNKTVNNANADDLSLSTNNVLCISYFLTMISGLQDYFNLYLTFILFTSTLLTHLHKDNRVYSDTKTITVTKNL